MIIIQPNEFLVGFGLIEWEGSFPFYDERQFFFCSSCRFGLYSLVPKIHLHIGIGEGNSLFIEFGKMN